MNNYIKKSLNKNIHSMNFITNQYYYVHIHEALRFLKTQDKQTRTQKQELM